MLEPEDALKWEVVIRKKGFSILIKPIKLCFCTAHKMKVRGHYR